MSRRTILCLVALLATTDAFAADQAAPVHRPARTVIVKSPPGLRAHHNDLTTVATEEPYSDALISMPSRPLLLGSSALPGYYGGPSTYKYQGAYYGGSSSYVPYFLRMPYACGIIGYC